MTDILIILFIIAVLLAFVFRKPRPISPAEILDEALEKRGYAPIIEDNSHLKQQLTEAQVNYSKALQQLGNLNNQLQNVTSQLSSMTVAKVAGDEALAKVTSQKKSGEVRLGLVSEQVLPMLPEFPVPISTLKFFGNPIDYISIDLDSEWISFIEVKSGGSVLSDKQKKIRKMIQDKKVRFFEVRVDDKGIKVK